MAITITLDDDLVAGLQGRAKKRQLSVEQFAIGVLTEAIESECATPREIAAEIQAIPPNPSRIRPATEDLADLLRSAPGDPRFDLETWTRQWSVIEAEMKAIARANDIAEGRGG